MHSQKVGLWACVVQCCRGADDGVIRGRIDELVGSQRYAGQQGLGKVVLDVVDRPRRLDSDCGHVCASKMELGGHTRDTAQLGQPVAKIDGGRTYRSTSMAHPIVLKKGQQKAMCAKLGPKSGGKHMQPHFRKKQIGVVLRRQNRSKKRGAELQGRLPVDATPAPHSRRP